MVWLEIFLLAAFFVGLALGDDGKIRCARWWRHWAAVLELVVLAWRGWARRAAGVGKPGNRSSTFHGVLAVCGASLTGVLLLRHSLCGSANRCVR